MATDLQTAFDEACRLWNEQKYDELGKHFDVDIIMKKLDDPGSIVGIGNVLVYLNEDQAQKKPMLEKIKPEEKNEWADHTVAQISGTAHYRDKAKDTTTTPVRFSFTFTRAKKEEDWLLINAFQSRRNE